MTDERLREALGFLMRLDEAPILSSVLTTTRGGLYVSSQPRWQHLLSVWHLRWFC